MTPDTNRRRTFLTADWRYLVMLNYEVTSSTLAPYIPPGTEPDGWQGKTFLSLVGLLFQHTRVMGLAIPWHRDFPEVNLRCYVRYRGPEGWRRGVVFIKEIVPLPAVAFVARLIYNENYVALPMRFAGQGQVNAPHPVSYAWRHGGTWLRMHARAGAGGEIPPAGSQEEFITEHYWGYAAQRGGGTLEYRVEHPLWRVWRADDCAFEGDARRLYGPALAGPLAGAPSSAFIAEGSPVSVLPGVRLPGA